MEPITDFVQQLLPDYVERIHYFSCGHGNSNLTKVIPNTQLLTISLPTGPSGMALKYSYEFRNNPVLVLLINKINETGLIIANYTKTVPNGIVVFFPSYKYLKVVYEHWKATGISTRIEKQKTIFLESNEQKENTEDILTKYSDCIKSGRGALLLAIVGGKLGEGINFSDELGRMVIMIGLPFANIKSPELIEKMKFLDKQGQSGSEYYENICMKQVNQCIGRAIRHLNDYAVIVLLDQRYKTDRIKMKLPKWIRDGGINEQGFGKTFGLVSKFFKDNSSRFGSNS
jgi:chromosome transmission fidelity protein 1